MTRPPVKTHRRWLRLTVGGALVGVCLVSAAGSWDALAANHPAYPISLLLAFVVGLALVVSGWRPRTPPQGHTMGRIERGAATIGGIAIAGMLLWLQPAVATQRGLEALDSNASVSVTDSRTQTVYEPVDTPTAGLVLYPGGKVDPRAYAPIARGIAEGGFRVVVPKCAFDIALTCEGVAQKFITSDIPWAVGGHSLGGVAASTFAAGGAADGLLLLASYPVSDLSGLTVLDVVSISGTRDGLATPTDIAESKPLLPSSTQFVPIEGAIHAYFGDYGPQRGDGTPTITREQAQRRVIQASQKFLERLTAESDR